MTPPNTKPTSDKPVIVLGAGGHARVLISLLRLINRPVKAVLDDDTSNHHQIIDGLSIAGGLDFLTSFEAESVELVNAIGSAHRPTARQAIYDRYTELGYTFATLIHPNAVIAPHVKVKTGAQIMASATVQSGVNLQHNCLINTAAVIDHDSIIGEHTHIAPGAIICGNVKIGPCCHIGCGATMIQGISVGRGAVIGAGATVINNVCINEIVVGKPARPTPP